MTVYRIGTISQSQLKYVSSQIRLVMALVLSEPRWDSLDSLYQDEVTLICFQEPNLLLIININFLETINKNML